MNSDRVTHLRMALLYLSTRKVHLIILGAVALGVATAVWGSWEAATPAALDGNETHVPLWRLFAVGSAILPVLSLTGPLDTLEAAAGPAYFRLRHTVLFATFAVSFACIVYGGALQAEAGTVPLVVRATPAWFGLALLSARILGRRSAWILPWAVMCALIYWGPRGQGAYHWWDFSASPPATTSTAWLSAALFALGVGAHLLTPWRVRTATRFRFPRQTEHQP